jgi:ABC-type branched-subunit amino acid transport system substrate-binding protein
MRRAPALTRRHALRLALAAGTSGLALPSFAQGEREIRIGQSCHLSGPLAATMTTTLRGQDLAIDEVNKAGGINGRPLKLIKLDDAYEPQRVAANTRQLIEKEGVTALFGYANSTGIAASLPLLAEKRVPLVGVYSGVPALRAKHHPYFFTTTASFEDEVSEMVRNLVTLQQSQIGLVTLNNPFGQMMQPVVEKVVAAQGATLVHRQPLEVDGSNAEAAARALAAKQPKAVLMMAFGPSTVAFVRAAKRLLGVPVYTLSVANVASLIKAMGDDARGLAITQSVPYPWRETTRLTRDFNNAARKAGLVTDYELWIGYLNTRVLIEGLKRSGRNLSPETLTRALESMSNVDIGGYEVDYSPSRHHGSKFVEITIVGPEGKFLR